MEGMPSQFETQQTLGKRKRLEDDELISSPAVTQDEETLDAKQGSNDSRDEGYDDNEEQLNGSDDDEQADDSGVEDDTKNDSENEDDDDDEHDSEDESEEGSECDYLESQEPYPQEPIYDPGIDEIKKGCAQRIADLKKILNMHACTTATVQGFQEKVESLGAIPDSNPIKVAFLGNTGVGKSCACNALLDNPELAKEGASGSACTCVATELRGAFPNQEERYAAKAVYFTAEAMSKFFKDLLMAYNLFNFQMDKAWPQEEKDDCRERAISAFGTMMAIFNQLDDFSSEVNAKKYLESEKDDIDTTVTSMQDWAIDLIEEREEAYEEDGRFYEYYEAATAKRLQKLVNPLVSARTDYTEPAMWPLVEKVSISDNRSRVLRNLTIYDLPGVTDTCQTRVEATTRYLKECDVLWVVARIDRIVTDTSVQEALQRYAERFEGRVAIIATRADDMDMSVYAKHLEDERHDVAEYKQLQRERKSAQNIARKSGGQLKRLEDRNLEDKEGLGKQYNTNQRKANDCANKSLCILVNMRNEIVTTQLRLATRHHFLEGTKLDIFPISSTHYAAVKGKTMQAPPCLDAAGTGVPALRSYALSLAAPVLLQTFETYVNHQFFVFIKGLDLWANSRHVKGPEDLRSIVDRPRQAFTSRIETFVSQMKDQAEHKISIPIQENQAEYALAAQEYVQDLNTWYWSTLKSWINHNGNRAPTKQPKKQPKVIKIQPKVIWNEDLLKPVIMEVINPTWKELQYKSGELFRSLQYDLGQMLMQIVIDLNQEPDAVQLPLIKFSEMLHGQLAGMRTIVDRHQTEYKKELANIKLDATQDQESGYFTKAMKSCYELCQKDGGQGVKLRVLKCFEQAVTLRGDASPFVITGKATAQAIAGSVEKCAGSLSTELEKILDDIRANFDAMIHGREPDDSEVPVRQALTKYLDENKWQIEDLKLGLEKIKSKYEHQHAVKQGMVKQE